METKSSLSVKHIGSFLMFISLLILPGLVIAQDEGDFNDDDVVFSRKGFVIGLSLGSYFPNNYPASLYDGYGYDLEGNKRSFLDSWMYNKIMNQYGKNATFYGGEDQISQALGVQQDSWFFDNEDYMPTNMHFKTAMSVGLNTRYSKDGKNGVLLNVNAAILKASGNFTIKTLPPPGSTQVNNQFQTFDINGEEQRMMFQLGYQGVFGPEEGIQFFIEGGMHATLAKFVKNEIKINNLIINLTDEYNSNVGYNYYTGTRPVGFGLGAFAGLGFDINTSGAWDLQLVYNPLLEKVNIGYEPRMKLSHSIGIRAYYKLKN